MRGFHRLAGAMLPTFGALAAAFPRPVTRRQSVDHV